MTEPIDPGCLVQICILNHQTVQQTFKNITTFTKLKHKTGNPIEKWAKVVNG